MNKEKSLKQLKNSYIIYYNVKMIKKLGLKVNTQIVDEKIRVQGAKKDDLQIVIQKVKEADLSDEVETSTLVEDFPVQFVNYQ